MGVEIARKEYREFVGKWKKCRTVVEGEDAVKDAGVLYLPMLGGQRLTDYMAYKERALFYGASGRTVEGLVGAIFRKEPQLDPTDKKVVEELASVTQDHLTARDFATEVTYEVLVTGRMGILIDAPKDRGTPYLAPYTAESIINWQTEPTETGRKLTMVVLEEVYVEPNPNDEFTPQEKKQYRVLDLGEGDEAGFYRQRIFRRIGDSGEEKEQTWVEFTDLTVQPTLSGRKFDYIPFYFINPYNQSTTLYNPPLLSLVNVNLSHYRSSADLEHGRHFTGLPTAWVAGFDAKTVLMIGSQTAWVSENPEARAGFLEFTGQGLGSLENALKEKQDMMAVLGARMLEDPKKAVEAADTLVTRYRGENSVLATIAGTVSDALGKIYSELLVWRGINRVVSYELNSDFISVHLSHNEVRTLMEAWQNSAISWETLFFNFQRGELYPDGLTMEDEANKIGTEVPMDDNSRMQNKVPSEPEEEPEDEIDEEDVTSRGD